MCEIWHDDALHIFLLRHYVAIFILPYDKFEPPEPVCWQAESTAYCWPLWVAEKSEVFREE